MPTSVIAAVVAWGASAAVGGGVVGAIIGAAAAAGVSMAFSSAFRKNIPRVQSNTGMIRTSDAPHQIVYGRARLGGVITYAQSVSSNRNLYLVLTFTGHEIDDFETFYFNEEAVPFDGSGNATGKYADLVYKEENLGTTTQNAFPFLIAVSGGAWTTAHQQLGCSGVFLSLGVDPDVFPTGLPNISVVIKGKKVLDTRSDTTAWSANPALCLADYIVNHSGLGYTYDDFDEDALNAAANVCDEDVSLSSGSTEDRYTCNGVVSTAQTREEIIDSLLDSMAGNMFLIGGKLFVFAGAYETPTLSFDEDDLRGPINATVRRSRRDLFNTVRGKFLGPTTNYMPTDYPPYASVTYIEEDDDLVIPQNYDFPFTATHTTAQRLAKMKLERNRRQMEVVLPMNLSAYRLRPGEIFQFSFDAAGWVDKTFEVTSLRLTMHADEVGVDVVAREIDSNVFAWTSAEEQALPSAPSTSLPNPFTVQAPGAPTFSEALYETIGSSGVKTRLTVSWEASTDGFVEGGGVYQLEYAPYGSSSYKVITNIKASSFDINDAEPGLFTFRIKAVSSLGVSSSYSSATYEVIGLSALPTNVNSFSVRNSNGFAHITWGLHADLDVRIGGVIEVRHAAVGSLGAASWPDSVLIDRFDGGQVVGIGPLVEGVYMAKARDSSLNYCSSQTAFFIDETLIQSYTTVASLNLPATFTGSKYNTEVLSGQTYLSVVNPSSAVGQFYFPNSPFYLDVGSTRVRRFEADIGITRFDIGDLIDSRGPVDEWSSVDGGAVDDGNVALYVQTTKDNPAGSPVWTEWTPFRVADFNARAARFKLEFEITQPTHNVAVHSLAVHVKVPAP